VKNTRKSASGSPERRWSYAWWSAAVLVVGLGYVDLARGGETAAPILLILGYCVFLPLAILR
jgi:hypothetical protein